MDKERRKGGVKKGGGGGGGCFYQIPPTFIPNINFIALSEPFQG